jgi:hypothetical protein
MCAVDVASQTSLQEVWVNHPLLRAIIGSHFLEQKRPLAIIDARPVPIQSGEAVPVAANVSVGFSFEGGEQNPRERA